jgi:lipoprotein-anchoring transpeptidase ErfK/SrfK
MMIKHILAALTAAMAGAAAVSCAQAQQTYPVQQSPVYSQAPYPYPPNGAPPDYRRGPPNFDALDDEEANATALPPPGPARAPGPILSPDDPRYANAVPNGSMQPPGPVMSPDDPRYGRTPGPPPVIYADRPPGAPPPQSYPVDRGYDPNAPRPPEAVGAATPPQGGPPAYTGSVQQAPPVGADGRPITIASLPPEEQPDAAPAQLAPNLRRQEVSFVTKEPAGTIVVDTPNTYLYYVLGGGRAIRYGVRVGREGFTWTGVQKISKKTEWPDWYPPTEMIERQPYLPRFMAGGPGNPLGARAMYLGSTVYRIHGTNQPSTIGKFVSSGCIGMLNEDVSDLFEHAKVGTRVVVMPGGPPPGTATASAAPAQPMPGQLVGQSAPPQQQMSAAPPPPTPPAVVPPLPAPVTVR